MRWIADRIHIYQGNAKPQEDLRGSRNLYIKRTADSDEAVHNVLVTETAFHFRSLYPKEVIPGRIYFRAALPVVR